jgi:hypothetical protein
MKLVMLALLAACDPAPKRFSSSDLDIARIATKRLAFESFPQWAASHPQLECPPTIEALLEYSEPMAKVDPWGTPYKMLCGASLPPDVLGLGVFSFGPDRVEGNADDIHSWDARKRP